MVVRSIHGIMFLNIPHDPVEPQHRPRTFPQSLLLPNPPQDVIAKRRLARVPAQHPLPLWHARRDPADCGRPAREVRCGTLTVNDKHRHVAKTVLVELATRSNGAGNNQHSPHRVGYPQFSGAVFTVDDVGARGHGDEGMGASRRRESEIRQSSALGVKTRLLILICCCFC